MAVPSLDKIKRVVKNGLQMAAFGYEVTLTARRSPTPDKSAIDKITANDLKALRERVPGMPSFGVGVDGLPLKDRALLQRFYDGWAPLLDGAAREAYLRNQLVPLLDFAESSELLVGLASEIAESFLRSGLPEQALGVLGRFEGQPVLAPLAARVEAALEASRKGLAEQYPEDPKGIVFTDRHAFLRHVVEERGELFSNKRVLHIAPETDVKAIFEREVVRRRIQYETLDAFSPIATIKDDLRALALADATYDTVFCHHVLEHVMDDARALRELHRILKPGGMFYVSVPQTGTLETTVDWGVPDHAAHGHVRMYGKDTPARLAAAGFDVKSYSYIETWRGAPWHRPYHLCTKRPA